MSRAVINPAVRANMGTICQTDLLSPSGDLDELKCLWYLVNYICHGKVNSDGGVYGLTFRQDDTWARLTVKRRLDDIPEVAFVSDKTTTRCARIFCRQWFNGTVKWYPDKFA